MECVGWVKTGTEEAAAADFTKYPDHFNLEVAEGAFKGFPPRLMWKAPQEHISINCIYLFDKHAVTKLCPCSAAAIFGLEWSFSYDVLFPLFFLVL